MSHIVHAARLTPEEQQSMDLEIKGGLSEFGASDDILRQPLPVAYTRSGTAGRIVICRVLKDQVRGLEHETPHAMPAMQQIWV